VDKITGEATVRIVDTVAFPFVRENSLLGPAVLHPDQIIVIIELPLSVVWCAVSKPLHKVTTTAFA
jgi:hypothetical protein